MPEQVIRAAEEVPQAPAGSERRIAVRYSTDQGASCYSAGGMRFERHWAQLRDVSTVGVGLLVSCTFEAGESLILELPRPVRGIPYGLKARVVRVVPQG